MSSTAIATAATGFLVAGPYQGQVTAKTVEPIRYDQLDDMVATLGSSLLGMTIGCARCHDHKYDPIGHRDYHAMIACLGKTVQRDTDFDLDPATTKQKRDAWLAERALVAASFERFLSTEVPSRLARWLASEAPARQATGWLALRPESTKATKATLTVEAGDTIVASGSFATDDVYTLTFRTHQRGIQRLRLEALATPAAPGGGPGTGKNGAFELSRLEITATPLVPAPDRTSVKPKLKAVMASSEAEGHKLEDAVDSTYLTGWSVDDVSGKDQAAVFAFDKPIGFEGGTQIRIELGFHNGHHGLARLRLAMTTEPTGNDLAAAAAPQAAREIGAVLEGARSAGRDLSDPEVAREAARWLGRFDVRVEQEVSTLAAIDAKEPKLLSAPDAKPLPDSRLGLANFLTDVAHGSGPLATRVIVNRLWHHHFGRGIVATPNDLGTQADPATHPELLEWLANRIVENGWSLKSIHRLIVTSATYRQSGAVSDAGRAKDPDNKLLWHRKPTRLEGESIRDALLAAAGTLDPKMYRRTGLDRNAPRRSIYLTVKRSEPIGFLQVFDQPEPVQPVGARGVATVPTQALAMMNSPFVRSAAEGLAKRARTKLAIKPTDASGKAAIDFCFTAALSRQPSDAERARFAMLLAAREQANAAADSSATRGSASGAWRSLRCLAKNPAPPPPQAAPLPGRCPITRPKRSG